MKVNEPDSARLRLQALLDIPETQRTEVQWDEINELEIILAPGNREGVPERNVQRNATKTGTHVPNGGRAPGKKPLKKFHRKHPKRNHP